MLLGMISNPFL